jgi:hypothetical protein
MNKTLVDAGENKEVSVCGLAFVHLGFISEKVITTSFPRTVLKQSVSCALA